MQSAIRQVSAESTSSDVGVISADHLFNGQPTAPQQITQTGHRRQARKQNSRRQCNCPNCQASGGSLFDWMDSEAEEFDLGTTLFGDESLVDVGGWMQFGYHDQNDGVFNTKPGDFQAQQINLFVEKVADGSEGLDIGGRVDVMYGTDAPNTQSFGNNNGVWDFDANNPNYWSNRNGQYGWSDSPGVRRSRLW
ncbi:MAG: outer membrane beta-barrel protein [Planctomycetaceae bacterium]